MKVVVHWKHRKTDQRGHREPIDYHDARAAVTWANAEYPDIAHWIEFPDAKEIQTERELIEANR